MGIAESNQLHVCAACGKMFVRESLSLCPNCATNEHARFALVRQYLRDHGGRGSITEVARATGLPRAEVGRYIMQGRLIEVDPGSGRPRGGARQIAEAGDSLDQRVGDEADRYRAARRAEPRSGADDDADRVRYVRRSRRDNRAS